MTKFGPKASGTNPSGGLAQSAYAIEKKRFMDVINNIRSTGAAADVDLPTIVVTGDQSSGKSSLIEAVSGVNLPRASGTCTRVPIEVRLRQESRKPWQCVVKIRRETDDLEKEQGKIPERLFGKTLTNPDEVGLRVRQAQLCILYQGANLPDDSFLNCDLAAEKPFPRHDPLRFSRDVVVLEIAGPQVADLTLVDLPGLIHYSDHKEDVPLVESLVKSYIQKDALILVVMPMNNDINNQKAVALALEVDPEGRRSIGVLTKADTLPENEARDKIEALSNGSEKVQFKQGFFVVRLPKPDELKAHISFDEARGNEVNFFTTKEPWSHISPELKRRLGTKPLTSFLSDQLLLTIKHRLPSLRKEIKHKNSETEKALQALGDKPSDDSCQELHAMVRTFARRLQAYTEGEGDHEILMQSINNTHKKFRKSIWATCPRIVPFFESELMAKEPRRVVEGDSEDDDDDTKTEPGDEKLNGNPEEARQSDGARDIAELREDGMGRGGKRSKALNLDNVRSKMQKSLTRELPNEVPSKVKTAMIKDHMHDWETLAIDMLNDITPMVENCLNGMTADFFGKYTDGALPDRIEEITSKQIQLLHPNALGQVKRRIKLEQRVFTMNSHYLHDVGIKTVNHLYEIRKSFLNPASINPPDRSQTVTRILRDLASLGNQNLTEATINCIGHDTRYENELRVMADGRAYWQVAYKRIIDDIPMIIDSELISPASELIETALIKELGIFEENGKERASRYLAESLDVMQTRKELENRLERLKQAKKALAGFA